MCEEHTPYFVQANCEKKISGVSCSWCTPEEVARCLYTAPQEQEASLSTYPFAPVTESNMAAHVGGRIISC